MEDDRIVADLEDFVLSCLKLRPSAIGYALSRGLADRFPGLAMLEGSVPAFNLEAYAGAGLCNLAERPAFHSRRAEFWLGPEEGTLSRPQETLFDVGWESRRLLVLIAHWQDMMGTPYHYFILGQSEETVHDFHAAVCAWNTREPEEYILVFDVNGWSKDEALLGAIRDATLDTLILRGSLKEEIVEDVRSFFTSRDTYKEYGIPWKRGILFVGPPGNGKTLAVKGLINALGVRCIYVRLFGPPFNIRMVFDQARALAPCILVLEDLDSLVTPETRSYFLNDLDGFALNEGILTLATTNHPERLDPAILDRPSRFDRKYPFDLPGMSERRSYVALWNASLKPALRLSETGCETVAELAEDFSFAYLKELFLSSMMRWIAQPQRPHMDEVMREQVALLREQMRDVEELIPNPAYPPVMPMARHRGPRGPFPGPHPTQPQDIPM
jgi:DNA polymerase III delta prime subunit